MTLDRVPVCGECDDGYVFEPPLQDGGLGVSVKCERCAQLARNHWSRNYAPRGCYECGYGKVAGCWRCRS